MLRHRVGLSYFLINLSVDMPKIKNQVDTEFQEEQDDGGPDVNLAAATRASIQAKASDSEKHQRLLEELDKLFAAENVVYDPEKGSLETLGDEEMKEVLDELPNLLGQVAESRRQNREPASSYGAEEVPAYRIGTGGVIKLDAKSDMRYSAGNHLLQMLPYDCRFQRIIVVEPARLDGIPEGYPELDIPAPTSERARRAIESGMPIGKWQRRQVRKRVLRYLKENNLTPVKADPATPLDGHPCQSWPLKAVGEDTAKAMASGISEMHYLSSLFSGGGFAGHDKQKRPIPKQSIEDCVQMEPGQISRVTEMLTGQVFEAGEIRDGGSPYVPSEDSEGTWKCLEGQFRSVSFPKDVFERLKAAETKEKALPLLEEAAVAKGTLRPYRRAYIRKRLEAFREQLRRLWPEEKAKAKALRQNYWRAYQVLKRALESEDDTLILAKGDQVKIPSSHAEGKALITRTFLEGEWESEWMEETAKGEKPSLRFSYEPDYGQNAVRRRTAAAHAHTESSVRAMPVQYPMKMNVQQYQLIKPEAEPDLYRLLEGQTQREIQKLCSLKGLAKLASDEEARTREEIENGEGAVVDQDKTLLNLAIQTGAIQMTSDGRERAIKGEPTSPSDIVMPPQIRARVGAVFAARIKNHILRGFGGEGKGYLHATVQDSQQLLEHIWRSEANASDQETVTYRREYPFYDPSTCALPKRVTDKMNADDDGDLTVGIAATYELEDGRIVKVLLLWRYPCVDVPIFMVLPAGMKTPFDAESEAQRETYKDILKVFRPYVPEDEPPVRSDAITLAETDRAWRLSDEGAKSQVGMERIEGDITPQEAFRFCERGASLNQAGPLTRRLERFGDLARRARLEELDNPGRAEEFRRAQKEFLGRADQTKVLTEGILSAFKYYTDADFNRPPSYVPETHVMKDPLRHHSDDNVQEAVLPMDYHGQIDDIERTADMHASEQDTTLESLELNVGSRISRYLQHLIENEISEGVEAIKRIQTDMSYLTHGPPQQSPGGLQKDLAEWYNNGATEEEAKLVKAQSQKIRQSFQVWRFGWTIMLEEQEEILRAADPVERVELAEELAKEQQEISQMLRRYMRSVAKGKRRRALQHAILVDWGQNENSPAAGMAAISDRLGEVFPEPDVTYTEADDDEETAVIFCHEDLPGLMYEKTQVQKIVLREDGDAVAEINGNTYHLFPANGEESIKQILPAKELSLRRVNKRRGVLQASY